MWLIGFILFRVRVYTNDSRAFVTVCLNQILKCFLVFENMKLLPQMVNEIKSDLLKKLVLE